MLEGRGEYNNNTIYMCIKLSKNKFEGIKKLNRNINMMKLSLQCCLNFCFKNIASLNSNVQMI